MSKEQMFKNDSYIQELCKNDNELIIGYRLDTKALEIESRKLNNRNIIYVLDVFKGVTTVFGIEYLDTYYTVQINDDEVTVDCVKDDLQYLIRKLLH